MKLIKNRKFWFIILICIVLSLYLKIYKFDRYFISSKNSEDCVTYFKDGNSVYIMPFKYWGLSNPKTNYLKFDRSNYSEEMNILIFYRTEKYPFVFEYESGDLVGNKLDRDCYFLKRNKVFNNSYLKEIRYGENEKNIEITSSYIRDNNPFWWIINKIF